MLPDEYPLFQTKIEEEKKEELEGGDKNKLYHSINLSSPSFQYGTDRIFLQPPKYSPTQEFLSSREFMYTAGHNFIRPSI